MLASGSHDKTIRLWDLRDNGKMKTVEANSVVTSLAYSPDGKLLASASDYSGPTISLWTPTGDRLLRSFGGYGNSIETMAFSPDSRLLATASNYDDNSIRLWNPNNGRLLGTLCGHEGFVNSVAFNPDGDLLISTSRDRTIRLWNIYERSQNLLLTLEGHDEKVTFVTFSPDGKLIASAYTDKSIRLWDPEDGSLLRIIENIGFGDSLAFSPDSSLLAGGILNSKINLWDMRPIRVFQESMNNQQLAKAMYRAIAFVSDMELDNLELVGKPRTPLLFPVNGYYSTIKSDFFPLLEAPRPDEDKLWQMYRWAKKQIGGPIH